MDVLTLVLLLAWFWFSALDVRVGVFAAPQCTIASPLSQNSLGQSPCVVIVDLWAYCTGLDETWQPLLPTESYAGPDAALGEVNPCSCSSVAYSMMSACGYCQGAAWTSWALYIAQCAGAQNTGFPSPIPAGINIPHWAYIGPTTWSDGFWDPVAATSIGDSPESSAGGGTSATTAAASTQSNTPSTRLPSSSTTITFVSGSATATNSASSPPKSPPAASTSASSKASNVGPIVGGVVAGVVVIAGAAVAVMWLCMRRRPQDEHQAPVLTPQQPPFSPPPMSTAGPIYNNAGYPNLARGQATSYGGSTFGTNAPTPLPPGFNLAGVGAGEHRYGFP